MITVDHTAIAEQDLAAYDIKLGAEFQAMHEASQGLYEDDRASINLSIDSHHLRITQRLAAKYKKCGMIVVIGIGGSNLGTIAVQEAILGKQYNLFAEKNKKPRILYADTVDPDSLATINELMTQELKRGRNVVLNAVSKSGGTTETIANFEILLQTLVKYKKSTYKKFVVVTTDEDSHFWHVAKEQGFAVLPIPKKVGGRYSVFSPVGLFPLAVIGVDTKKLLDGAAHMRALCIKRTKDNPAFIRAALLAHARSQGLNIADNFYFKTDLESIGKWYRQLMGESIGKEWNKEHSKQVWMGITPTVSIGSTDLHSMAQLYFGGPKDKFFTLVTVNKWKNKGAVPHMDQYDALVPNIQGKNLSVIMNAISNGVMITLRKMERPYCHINLPDTKEQSIGALLQLHMMEMMYLAALLGVNAFDQPNVEVYKIETKKILARK